ncbi:MAG: pseudaminic acid cytidylyltransferase [Bdellovibrionales bacterium]|nr:pseudaminic acid cytidylyltransferase [Ramlibacter sp.]
MKVAIIPARGGSKRIPRKNIRLFAGQPVINYPIKAALASGCFDEVIVSTDDPEIAETARAAGASVPFTRPPELADDHTVLADVVAHALGWYDARGHAVSQACCVFATAPFITPAGLRAGLDALNSQGRSFALSITSFPFPVQRAIRMAPGGSIDAMYPEHRLTRSQDLEPGWHDAGQFCWGTRQAFLDRLPVFAPHTAGVALPRHLVQDLDTLEDWHRAELMYEVLRQTGELP